jgi:hypothetical protein
MKAWCSNPITKAFLSMSLWKIRGPAIVQSDLAPGHRDPILKKMMTAAGYDIIWTPPGCSAIVQPCDSLINATFQQRFDKETCEWGIQKMLEHHESGNSSDGIPNPTLEEVCQLVANAAKFIPGKVSVILQLHVCACS